MYYLRKDLPKMSLEKLITIQATIRHDNPNLDAELILFRTEETKMEALRKEKKQIEDKIDKITNDAIKRANYEYNNSGVLKQFFTNKNNITFTQSEINELNRLRNILNTTYQYGFDNNKYRAASNANFYIAEGIELFSSAGL